MLAKMTMVTAAADDDNCGSVGGIKDDDGDSSQQRLPILQIASSISLWILRYISNFDLSSQTFSMIEFNDNYVGLLQS